MHGRDHRKFTHPRPLRASRRSRCVNRIGQSEPAGGFWHISVKITLFCCICVSFSSKTVRPAEVTLFVQRSIFLPYLDMDFAKAGGRADGLFRPRRAAGMDRQRLSAAARLAKSMSRYGIAWTNNVSSAGLTVLDDKYARITTNGKSQVQTPMGIANSPQSPSKPKHSSDPRSIPPSQLSATNHPRKAATAHATLVGLE